MNDTIARTATYRVTAELQGPRTAQHPIPTTTGIVQPGSPYWVVMWQSHLMSAPAFWYFSSESHARASLENFS